MSVRGEPDLRAQLCGLERDPGVNRQRSFEHPQREDTVELVFGNLYERR
jgi:hypothetical protein